MKNTNPGIIKLQIFFDIPSENNDETLMVLFVLLVLKATKIHINR